MESRRASRFVLAFLPALSPAATGCGTPSYSCEETYTCPEPPPDGGGDAEAGQTGGAAGKADATEEDGGGGDAAKDVDGGKGGKAGTGGAGGSGAGGGGTGGAGGSAGGGGTAGEDAAADADAADAGVTDTGADGPGADADAPLACGPGTKLCGQACVADGNPGTGCAQPGCAACAFEHAAAICVAGKCALGSCQNGWANCDGNEVNGCETNTAADVANCGGCGTKCTYVNATGKCVGGTCQIDACKSGFGDCDGQSTTGCETPVSTDPKHCGKCAHDCLGGACQAGTCQPVKVAAGPANGFALVVAGGFATWTGEGVPGGVWRVPTGGGGITTVADFGQKIVYGLAIDGTNVYVPTSDGEIMVVPLAGGMPAAVATGQSWAMSLAVDASSVYFARYTTGTLSRVAKTGGTVTVIASGLSEPGEFVIDSTYAYVPTGSSPYALFRIPLTGGVPLALAVNAMYPFLDGATAFFVAGSEVAKVPTSGGSVTVLTSGALAKRVAADASDVYWTVSSGGVRRMPKGGGAAQTLTSANAGALALDATAVYWFDQNAVMKVAK